MDTLIVTMDALFAAMDRHIARKESLIAGKEGAFTAKSEPIVRMVGHIAVKSRDCESLRVIVAAMKGGHAMIRGRNAAKRLSLAAMKAPYATIDTFNAAMGALIAAKCAFNAATLREDPSSPRPSSPDLPIPPPREKRETSSEAV